MVVSPTLFAPVKLEYETMTKLAPHPGEPHQPSGWHCLVAHSDGEMCNVCKRCGVYYGTNA